MLASLGGDIIMEDQSSMDDRLAVVFWRLPFSSFTSPIIISIFELKFKTFSQFAIQKFFKNVKFLPNFFYFIFYLEIFSLNSCKIITEFTSHFHKYYTKFTNNFSGIFLLPQVNFSLNFIKLLNFFLIFGKLTQSFTKFYIKFA